MEHPQTRALFEYWNALRGGRAAPFRSEIDPRKIGIALEKMFVLEVLPEGRLRFRVAGSGLTAMFGLRLRGMVSDSIMTPDSAGKLRMLAKRVLETPAVGEMTAEAISGVRRHPGLELLLLPLRSETGEMNRLLGCISALGETPARGEFDQLRLSCLSVTLGEQPIEVTAEPLDGFMGMAEAGAPFLRDAPSEPRLTAIEGARRAAVGAREDRPAKGRGHLRLVKD